MTDTTKLRVAPGSEFFKVEDGKILFRYTITGGWFYISDNTKRLIATVAVKEWRDELDKHHKLDHSSPGLWSMLGNCREQIRLWAEYGGLKG